MWNFGCWILNVGFWMLDFGFWDLDVGCLFKLSEELAKHSSDFK